MSPLEAVSSALIAEVIKSLPDEMIDLLNQTYSDTEGSAITQGRGSITLGERERVICTVFGQLLIRKYLMLDDESKKAVSIGVKRTNYSRRKTH